MNLRHPKTIRLGGWGAGVTTLLVVAAGAYLALHFIQAGDVLNGGLIAVVTAVGGLFGGLLSYCLFVFARMQPASAEAPVVAPVEEEVAEAVTVEETPADEDEAIAISVTKLASEAPPEFSDDEMPVFAPSQSPSMGDVDSDDFDPSLPPPIDAVDDSDSIAVERSVSAEDFDSAMDLPVRIDAPELNVEDMDVVPPVVQSQTTAVVSSLTQTDEVDALDIPTASVTPEPLLPQPVAKRTLPDSFPDIFKTAPFKPSPLVSETPAAPAPVPQKPAPAPAPVEKVAPAAVFKPAPLPKPPVTMRSEPAAEESLPVVDDLSDIAITLGPVTPTGVLPTEIPDFFLKMPTGRSMPAAPKPTMPAMPVAPVAPRQVAPQKPVNHAAAVVKIIDSTTVADAGDDLVTMTAIPDDWPS